MSRKFLSNSRGIISFVQAFVGLALLIALFVVLNAFFSSRSFQTTSQPQRPVSQSPSPTHISGIDQSGPRTGWTDYTNSTLGYSMKYPSNWFEKGYHVGDWGSWQDFTSVDVEAPTAGLGSGIWLRVSTIKTINQEGFWNTNAVDEYFDYLRGARVGEVRTSDPRYLITKLENLTVAGYPAVKQIKETAPDAQTEHMYVIEVYVLKDKELQKIEGVTLGKKEWQTHKDVFDRILQTFQFVQ